MKNRLCGLSYSTRSDTTRIYHLRLECFCRSTAVLVFFLACANRFRLVDLAGIEPLRKWLRQRLVPGDGNIKFSANKCQITEETPQIVRLL